MPLLDHYSKKSKERKPIKEPTPECGIFFLFGLGLVAVLAIIGGIVSRI